MLRQLMNVRTGGTFREKRLYKLMAIIMNLTLLRFFISQRVPRGSPTRFAETFTSHLSEPYIFTVDQFFDLFESILVYFTCSMLPSLDPTERRIACSVLRYSPACSGDLGKFSFRTFTNLKNCSNLISGSETISISPVPALFRSTLDSRASASNVVFAVSYTNS